MIVKNSTELQLVHKATYIVFDKTGTLTDNCFAVSMQRNLLELLSLIVSLILGLTENSGHPVAAAVARHLKALDFKSTILTDIRNMISKGIKGFFNGETIKVGNFCWLDVEEHLPMQYLLLQGLIIFCIIKSNNLIVIFGLITFLRGNAKIIICTL